MAVLAGAPSYLEFKADDDVMLSLLREPLYQALGGRCRFYAVEIAAVGRVGEVLVSITGSRGRLPLLFGNDELEPGYVSSVVRQTVEKFAF